MIAVEIFPALTGFLERCVIMLAGSRGARALISRSQIRDQFFYEMKTLEDRECNIFL